MKRNFVLSLVSLGLIFSQMPKASAALLTSYQFNGNGNWSIDGVGSNNTPVGLLNAIVPTGSTIEKAFLYSTTWINSSFLPIVNFDGTVYTGSSWTDLGLASTCCSLKAFRADVTSQVAAKVLGGSASPFSFTVNEDPSLNSLIDGEVLAIIYSNPAETYRTIAFLDGNTAASGDTTTVNFANPLTSAQLANPGFDARLSLGIGFSYQQNGSDQYSTVDVNGQRLTSSAGGSDDGTPENGGLVTVGGIGDNPDNPTNPNAVPSSNFSVAPRIDDELYTLNSFLHAGDTTIKIDTTNPSFDDNIFFLGLNITAEAGVNQPAPTKTPESSSWLSLLALGGLGVSATLKRQKSPKLA